MEQPRELLLTSKVRSPLEIRGLLILAGYVLNKLPDHGPPNELKEWLSNKKKLVSGLTDDDTNKLGAFKDCTFVLMGLFDEDSLEVRMIPLRLISAQETLAAHGATIFKGNLTRMSPVTHAICGKAGKTPYGQVRPS